MTAIAGLLTRHQKLYVQRVSPLVIYESSSPESPFNSDSDQEPTFDAFTRSLKTMIKSKDKTDKRFIDLHRAG